MSEKITDSKESIVQSNNGVAMVSLPTGWAEVLETMPGDKVKRAVFNGAHGKFIAIWNPKQQAREAEAEKE